MNKFYSTCYWYVYHEFNYDVWTVYKAYNIIYNIYMWKVLQAAIETERWGYDKRLCIYFRLFYLLWWMRRCRYMYHLQRWVWPYVWRSMRGLWGFLWRLRRWRGYVRGLCRRNDCWWWWCMPRWALSILMVYYLAAPMLWNSLPDCIRLRKIIQFKKAIKTWLFKNVYESWTVFCPRIFLYYVARKRLTLLLSLFLHTM